MAIFSLDAFVVQLIVSIVVIAPVLWIAGRLLVGKEKAKGTDAIWIVVLGVVISDIFQYIFGSGIIASIILLVIFLGLIKHFFDSGWLKAFAIAILAVVFFAIIALIIAAIFGLALAAFFI